MVDFVDVFINPAMMQQAMQKIVPGVFNNGTAKALSQDEGPEKGGQERKGAKYKQSHLNQHTWHLDPRVFNLLHGHLSVTTDEL